MIDRVERQHISAGHYLTSATPDPALDHSVRLTARHFGFPMAFLNVLDRSHQYTIAAYGADRGVTPRSESLCDRVVRSNVPWVAQDLEHDSGGTVIRTYVGVPLTGREGLPIATLCLVDDRPREFTPTDLDELLRAALVVQDQLELRRWQRADHDTTPAQSVAIIRAIENDEIVPWYQPIVHLATGTVRGVEALARWRRPEGPTELPSGFLPAAESSDVIIDVDLAILAQAARAVAARADPCPTFGLNVNLSVRHFGDLAGVDRLTAQVLEAGLDPRRVNFEITETTALAVTAADRAFLGELHSRGFRIILDDFGTGFSAIGHVLHLPIDGIKIDRAVTQTLETRAGRAVLRALVQLAADLDLDTCIEGVETERQAELALDLGCRTGQGYLWGRPAPRLDDTRTTVVTQRSGVRLEHTPLR